jgi:hypothetical protein
MLHLMLDLPDLLGSLPFEITLGISGVLAWLALPEMIRAWRALSSARAIAAVRHGGAADGGLVIAEGHAAVLEEPRPAALSGLPSVWASWRVERRTRGRHRRWVVEEESASATPFLLRTSEGAVLVLPEGARHIALPVAQWNGTTPRPGSGPPAAGPSEGLIGPAYRYTEWRVAPGQPLFVVGRAEAPQPGDPPGILGRIGGGGAAFTIGGEAPEKSALRERSAAMIGAAKASGFLALAAAIWVLRG